MNEDTYRDAFDNAEEMLLAVERRIQDMTVLGRTASLEDLIDAEYNNFNYETDQFVTEYIENAVWDVVGTEQNLTESEHRITPELQDIYSTEHMNRIITKAIDNLEIERKRVTPAVEYAGWGGETVAFELTDEQVESPEFGISGPICHQCVEKGGLVTHTAEDTKDWFDLERREFLYMHNMNFAENPEAPYPPLCGTSLYCAGCSHDFYDWDQFCEDYKEWLKDEHGITVVESVSYEYTLEKEED